MRVNFFLTFASDCRERVQRRLTRLVRPSLDGLRAQRDDAAHVDHARGRRRVARGRRRVAVGAGAVRSFDTEMGRE